MLETMKTFLIHLKKWLTTITAEPHSKKNLDLIKINFYFFYYLKLSYLIT